MRSRMISIVCSMRWPRPNTMRRSGTARSVCGHRVSCLENLERTTTGISTPSGVPATVTEPARAAAGWRCPSSLTGDGSSTATHAVSVRYEALRSILTARMPSTMNHLRAPLLSANYGLIPTFLWGDLATALTVQITQPACRATYASRLLSRACRGRPQDDHRTRYPRP